MKLGLLLHFHSNFTSHRFRSINTLCGLDKSPMPVDTNSFVCMLQACTDAKSLKQVHGHLLTHGLGQNVFLGAKLVGMYATLDSLDNAHLVFDRIHKPSVFLWNVMIRECARKGSYEEALMLYYQMRSTGTQPDNFSIPSVLKACAGLSALQEGKKIHGHIVKSGFESDVFAVNSLVALYAKCGRLGFARQLFDKMAMRDVVSWNAMIIGYAQNGPADEALALFIQMQSSGVAPDCVTMVGVLQACAHLGVLQQGDWIHVYVIQRGFQSDVSVGNSLVAMYGRFGKLELARQLFDKMPTRDVISWNAMLGGYAQNGRAREALTIFHEMRLEDLTPTTATMVSVLQACACVGALEQGKLVHGYIIRNRLEVDVLMGTAIIDMYAKCGSIERAQQLFHSMSTKNVATWNAMIAGYAQSGWANEALALLNQMQLSGRKPNLITMVSVLPACSDVASVWHGKWIHACIMKNEFELDVVVETALIDMYAKCGRLEIAREIFDRMSERNVVSWNAMIAGYAQVGHANEALTLFCQMLRANVMPDAITIVSVLQACANLGALQQGKCIHGYTIQNGFGSDSFVGTAFIDMYAKCGRIDIAHKKFDKMYEKNEVSWNAMIAGCVQNGCATEALILFTQMQLANMKPDLVTLLSVLPACAHLAALQEGKCIHGYVISCGFESDVFMGNSLIDMYAKCGRLEFARQFFDKMSERDVVSWNVMIAGYGMHGHCKDALALFSQMQQQTCLEPNHVTFLCILTACSHAGLLDEGWQYFDCMSQDYCIDPKMEHYACMVDLLGRAGHLDEAQKFIEKMPIEPGASVWGAMLGACRIHCNIELAEHAAEHLFDIEPQNAGYYVLLSNIYAAAGRWDDVANVRTIMKNRGLKKTPGSSLIEASNRVHAFLADKSHLQSEKIFASWDK